MRGRLFIYLFAFQYLCCRFPLGPQSKVEKEERDFIIIKGTIVCEGDTVDGISVAILPYWYGFSSLVVSPVNVSRLAYALGITENKNFELRLPVPGDTMRYFILTGIGIHNRDENYVQLLRVNFSGNNFSIESKDEFTLTPSSSSDETLYFSIPLAKKVSLFVPNSDSIWESGDTLVIHPTLDRPAFIRWYYPDINLKYPSHTRFIFVLWSLEQGLIYYKPSTYEELVSQAPGFTYKILPETDYESSLLIDGKSYRITVLAVKNVDVPESLTAVSTELLFDGKFTYKEGQ